MNGEDIFTKGIMFKKVASDRPKEEKVKTKAKKKAYITGQHHSASAKMKAEIRRKRANRHKGGWELWVVSYELWVVVDIFGELIAHISLLTSHLP